MFYELIFIRWFFGHPKMAVFFLIFGFLHNSNDENQCFAFGKFPRFVDFFQSFRFFPIFCSPIFNKKYSIHSHFAIYAERTNKYNDFFSVSLSLPFYLQHSIIRSSYTLHEYSSAMFHSTCWAIFWFPFIFVSTQKRNNNKTRCPRCLSKIYLFLRRCYPSVSLQYTFYQFGIRLFPNFVHIIYRKRWN